MTREKGTHRPKHLVDWRSGCGSSATGKHNAEVDGARTATRRADVARHQEVLDMICQHLRGLEPVPARTPGCEECLKTGLHWVHLRRV